VHKFVDEGCVHIDVYTNVYLLYTIFLSVWHDAIQYSPEAVSYPCTNCLLLAFDDA